MFVGRSGFWRTAARVAGLAALLLAAFLAACQGPVSPGGGAAAISVAAVEVRPLVAGPGESHTLSLELTGTSEPTVSFSASEMTELVAGGGARVTVYDDGTHGDLVAGDGTYTISGLDAPVGATGVASVSVTHFKDFLEVDGETQPGLERLKASFRAVETGVVGVPGIVDLAGGARATSRVVALTMPGRPALAAVGRRYYQLFPDDRDFLVVLRGPASVEDASGRAIHVRQHTVNIGASVATADETYGSDDRLQMVVELRLDAYRSNGSPGFCLLSHELMHRWAAFLGPPLQAENDRHWDASLARDSSAFGVGRGQCAMNDLELYLAGFLPPDSVVAPLVGDDYGIADVTGEYGVRLPDATTSQRAFNVAFVVVHDEPVRDHELAYFHHVASAYSSPDSPLGTAWSGVTGGRSTLDSRLPPPAPEAARRRAAE